MSKKHKGGSEEAKYIDDSHIYFTTKQWSVLPFIEIIPFEKIYSRLFH